MKKITLFLVVCFFIPNFVVAEMSQLYVKGIQSRVDVLSDFVFHDTGTQVVRIYTDTEQFGYDSETGKVGVWISSTDGFQTQKFIPLSNQVLKTGACPDQRKMTTEFMKKNLVVAKEKEVVAPPKVRVEKTNNIIFRYWQAVGVAKEMFCREGSNSRDFSKLKLAGVPRYTDLVTLKVVIDGEIDETFSAPEGFVKVETFFNTHWEKTISFSDDAGEYALPVDPRWLGKGYVKVIPLEDYVVYPRGQNLITRPGEIWSLWEKWGYMVFNLVYPDQEEDSVAKTE